jgi:hypothetical protein
MPESAINTGRLLVRGAVQKLVHGPGAGEEFAESRRADADGQGKTQRRPHGIAAAHPVPEQEGVVGGVAQLGRLRGAGGDGHEVFGYAVGGHAVVGQPALATGRVGEGFLGGEGFAGNHHQGARGIELVQHAVQRPGIGVGHIVHARAGAGQVGQGVGRHAGAEVGAANTDVDDVGERFVGVAGDGTAAHAIGKGAHPVEFARHVGAHGGTPGALLAAQSNMQHGAFFGGVDHVAAEHGVSLLCDTSLFGQGQQRCFDFRRNALAAGVERETSGADGHALGAIGVRFQGVAQVWLGCCGKLCERFPGREGGGRNVGCGHACFPK